MSERQEPRFPMPGPDQLKMLAEEMAASCGTEEFEAALRGRRKPSRLERALLRLWGALTEAGRHAGNLSGRGGAPWQ